MNTASKKHIVFISYYFPPMGGGGVQRVLKLLKYWDYTNYSVSVITVKPSFFYAQDNDLIREIPPSVSCYYTSSLDPFRIFFLFKQFFSFFFKKEHHSSLESSSFVRKITSFLFIPDSRIFWLPFVIYKIRKLNKNNKINLLIGTVPPFTSGLISLVCSYFFKIPYLVDFRDAWTHNPYLIRISSLHDFFQEKLEYLVLRNSRSLVFVNPHLKKYYENKYPSITLKSSTVIRNGFDPPDFTRQLVSKYNFADEVLSIGILGSVYSRGNSPIPLLKAVSNLIEGDPTIEKKIKMVFVGKWAPDFLKVAKKYPLTQIIHWIDYMSHRKLLAFAANLKVLSLAIDDTLSGCENVTPGRIYEYLFLKKPILCMCPINSDLAKLVRENDAGEVVSYSNILQLQHIISDWISSPSKMETYYKSYQMDTYNRKYLTEKYVKFVRENIP